jgi:hypothetical protein
LWNPADVLGRHVFSEPLTGGTTLLQLAEKVEQVPLPPRTPPELLLCHLPSGAISP